MSPQNLSIIGVILMAGCGSVLGRHVGFVGFEQVYVAGFAVGVVLLGQVPAIALRKRIVALEEQLARSPTKDV
jgi:hypothetical protein